jgi:hypothetical protein
MVKVSTMMSTAQAKTAQTENPHPFNPTPAGEQENGPKTPAGRGAGRTE